MRRLSTTFALHPGSFSIVVVLQLLVARSAVEARRLTSGRAACCCAFAEKSGDSHTCQLHGTAVRQRELVHAMLYQ